MQMQELHNAGAFIGNFNLCLLLLADFDRVLEAAQK